MRRFNLRREENDQWQVVDGETMLPAELDGTPVKGMVWQEACDMVDLMNSLDVINHAAKRYEKHGNVTR